MTRHAETIRLLLGKTPMTARQVSEKAGISQPTVSRALAALGDEVVRIGSGPAIQYALRNNTTGLVPVPIYRVSHTGQLHPSGTLIPVCPTGFVMVQTDGTTQHSHGLPWWLLDMRPQGYLGRAYAATHAPGLGLPPNPEHWSDTNIIRALLVQGHDATGNLLVGERARERFLEMPAPAAVAPATDYPALARAAAAGEAPGSSAGGEQPKFCTFTERGHVLVKFSAPDDNPVSERWRDLLQAEHLALSLLGIETRVFDINGQRFLEAPRFDRNGQFGRLGVFSLRALDAEFVGDLSAPWPALVRQLASVGQVHADAVKGSALLWAFGTLIGNTDMHAGNLSFTQLDAPPYPLAPPYDMLPMGFAPRSSGALINTLPPASLCAAVEAAIWRDALELAQTYLARVSDCKAFSPNFLPCIDAMRRHIDDAKLRIARLG